jgi:ABC-type Mn2+/Zn2+ transport system permease subunit
MTTDLAVVWEVMKWPLAASLLFPPLLVYMGLHVVKREVIFVDLALAQVATLGTCVALLMGYHFDDRVTFWISLAVTFIGAGFFSWTRSGKEQQGSAGSDYWNHVRRCSCGRDSVVEPRRRRKGRARAFVDR